MKLCSGLRHLAANNDLTELAETKGHHYLITSARNDACVLEQAKGLHTPDQELPPMARHLTQGPNGHYSGQEQVLLEKLEKQLNSRTKHKYGS